MKIDYREFQNLFGQVNALISKYKKVNELTGENFNVFKILKLESSEVRMHSAFIAELLNPKGSHGQKDVFLKLFIKSFCFKGADIDTASCTVEIEKHVGFINDDRTEGGRIDIFIDDKQNNHVIIENKIYAGDQYNQLVRYHQHSEHADILYLTLEGSEPNINSYGILKNGEHFKCISYKSNIIEWLEACRKECAVLPIIRESITQYINLIKYLTNQTLNHTMQEELSEIIKNNLEAAISIHANIDKALDKVSMEFGNNLEQEFEKRNLHCSYRINFKERYNGIWISKPEWKYINIGFQFQSYDKDMIYGFSCKEHPRDHPIPDALRKQLKALQYNNKKNNDWWPWFNDVEPSFKNWHDFNTWKKVIDGRMKSMIIEKTNFLLELVKDVEIL
ncbi:PD-(D/E)XK nuclease family protein [Agrobacterium tumefaciens]|nr:PD-(D/E)XK nuclease family protein [Agrobacterium tumefaciens]NTE25347.1 PD-(D/E)XK nuclease family protein [Agrobacterium tumefaciens]